MLVRTVIALAGLALLGGCDVLAQAGIGPTSPADRAVTAQVDTAESRREANDPQGVLIAIAPATDAQIFTTLSEPTRAEVLRLYGWGLSGVGQRYTAEEVYRQLADNHYETARDRFWRLRNASWNSDPGETAAALPPVLSQDDAGGLGAPEDVRLVDYSLGGLPDAFAARKRLGDRLEQIRWRERTEALEDGGALVERQIVWLHYAEALAKSDPGHAANVAAWITRPDLLIAMQADQRFDSLIASNPQRFDPDAAAQRALSDAEDAVKAEPRRLALRMTVATTQAQLGDFAAAERTLDDAITLARSGGPPGAVYHDACPCYVDALLMRTVFMAANGRADAALSALGDITATQDVAPNDMRLRQARLLLMMNRPAEAEQRLADMDEAAVSGYTALERAALKACVVAARGHPGDAAASLAYLEAHRTLDVGLFLDGEICAGNPDHTAAMLIEMLKQPSHAASALYQLQDVAGWPHDYAYRIHERQGRAALAARPDVAAAINAVGRVRHYDLARMGNTV